MRPSKEEIHAAVAPLLYKYQNNPHKTFIVKMAAQIWEVEHTSPWDIRMIMLDSDPSVFVVFFQLDGHDDSYQIDYSEEDYDEEGFLLPELQKKYRQYLVEDEEELLLTTAKDENFMRQVRSVARKSSDVFNDLQHVYDSGAVNNTAPGVSVLSSPE